MNAGIKVERRAMHTNDCRSWNGIKLSFGALAKAITFSLLVFCGCATNQRRSEYFESQRSSYVTIQLDGDVRRHGEQRIRRELSRESILEAAGGFAGLSVVKPKTVRIMRGSETIKVPFKDMGRGKWAEFLIDEGDRIVMERLFF